MIRKVVIGFLIDEENFKEEFEEHLLIIGDKIFSGEALLKEKCEEAARDLSGYAIAVEITEFP